MINENSNKVNNAMKWSVITEIAAKLSAPVISIILARLLLPEAFGLVATITIITSFVEVLSDAGFQKFIIQHDFVSVDSYNKSFSVAFWSNFTLSAIILLIVFVFKNSLADLLGVHQINNAIWISSTPILLNSYSSLQMAAYKRDFEFGKLFPVRIAVSLVPFITSVPLAVILRSYWAIIIGTASQSVVQFLYLLAKPKVKVEFYYSFKRFKEMFSFSFWTLFESVSIWLTSNVDVFIVGKLLNEYSLGLYKTSLSTVFNYMSIIDAAVIPVLFSALSRAKNDDKSFYNTYFSHQKRLAIILIPMGFGICLVRDFVTYILLGQNWMEASFFIGLIAFVQPFAVCICYFLSEVIRSKGQPLVSFVYQCIFIIIKVPAIYFSALHSFKALCITRAACVLIFVLMALFVGRMIYKIKIFDVVKNIFPQTVSGLFMYSFGFCFMRLNQSYLWQCLTIVLCALLYFLLLSRFKSMKNEIYEITEQIKSKTIFRVADKNGTN